MKLPIAAFCLCFLGCVDSTRPETDAGGDAEARDSGDLDAGALDAGALDAGDVDSGGGADAGDVDAAIPPGMTVAAPPADIVRTGTGGLLLRGTVLAPSGPIAPGEVLVVGNTITCVAADCSATAGASTATIVDTHATISPGLIDSHNHLTYDFLPEWVPPHLYLNRYQWRGDPSYSAAVDPEGDSNNDGMQDTGSECPGAKWGELRSIVHGTTTVQGESPSSSCIDRLARNVDSFDGLGADNVRTTISGACESGFPSRASLVTSFGSGTTRFFVHMAEGYDRSGTATRTDPLREFDCYAGHDTLYPTPSLLLDTAGTPYGTAVFIHAVPLTGAQLDEAIAAQARFVWSPSSNMVLYGHTADIAGMLSRGAVVGLGPDWTPSGSDEMLSELRYAHDYGVTTGVAALTPERLWRMATEAGADIAGHADLIGRLQVGYRADIAVFGRTGADPYQAVMDSRARDVRLVLIDGAGYFGDLPLEAATSVNGSCDMLDACGAPKYLCVANTPGSATRAAETMDDVHAQLRTILMSYGRESELLELVDCTL